MTVFKRLTLIFIGYVLAALASGYAVTAGYLLEGNESDATTRPLSFGLMVTMFIIMFAAAPAALVVALGEYRRIRHWGYDVAAGCVIGVALGSIFAIRDWFPWMGLGFGPVAGFVFWAIAGRNAGSEAQQARRAVLIIMVIIAAVALAVLLPGLGGLRLF
ncbi:MAG: hypothetical protein GYA66_15095 [Phyllobacteriaceae bacterium]|nr:hypothetical protein [Phyllobacteriaceae bacterium]